jgi:hypothetical protein
MGNSLNESSTATADADSPAAIEATPCAAWRRFALLALLALTVVCYWGTLDAFFVQDDFLLLTATRNPVPNMEMFRGVCFFRPLSTYWLPLLNVSLWGLSPVGHHVTYLGIFLATIALLYAWLRNATGSTFAALLGTSLYAFSKTHLYTLAWIAGGIDISAGFLLVLCLWAADRYFAHSASHGGQTSRGWLAVVGVSFACGLLCKESCLALAPACLAWIAARKLWARRVFEPAERALAVVVIVVAAVYLPLWKVSNTEAGNKASQLQCDPHRGLRVLQDSVLSIVPAAEADLRRCDWWMAIPLVFAGIAALRRRTPAMLALVALGLALWVLPASIFAFTRYPWVLQLYYAHFSVVGVAMLAGLAVTSLKMQRGAVVATSVVLFAVWLALAGRTIHAGVRDGASPALQEAAIAKDVHTQLSAKLQAEPRRWLILLDVSDIVWATMHADDWASLYFPNVTVRCQGRHGFNPPDDLRTTSTVLVLRQTGDRAFTVVR